MNLFAGKNEDADIENKLVDIVREGEGGKTEKVALTYIYIYSIMCKTADLRELAV